VVVSGWLEQETSIKASTENAEPNMNAFFIVRIVSSKTDSSQVASPDVLERRILLF